MFKYKSFMPAAWWLGNQEHQLDPLTNIIHEGSLVPLYEILGLTLEQAKEISTPFRLEQVREYRNKLLTETDWWVLPDRTPTQEQLQYRQQLRDFTNDFDPLQEVVFPEKP